MRLSRSPRPPDSSRSCRRSRTVGTCVLRCRSRTLRLAWSFPANWATTVSISFWAHSLGLGPSAPRWLTGPRCAHTGRVERQQRARALRRPKTRVSASAQPMQDEGAIEVPYSRTHPSAEPIAQRASWPRLGTPSWPPLGGNRWPSTRRRSDGTPWHTDVTPFLMPRGNGDDQPVDVTDSRTLHTCTEGVRT